MIIKKARQLQLDSGGIKQNMETVHEIFDSTATAVININTYQF